MALSRRRYHQRKSREFHEAKAKEADVVTLESGVQYKARLHVDALSLAASRAFPRDVKRLGALLLDDEEEGAVQSWP